MKCLIRIPFAPEYGWVVKFYQWQNRHQLDTDGLTIVQSAKDKLGEILTSYMKKTIFDPWCMGIPSGPHLRIALPLNYNRHGLTSGDLKAISTILKKIAQDDLCQMVMIHASLPGVSREQVIRAIWELIGLTDDDYDMEHFRRYFDRYGKNSVGAEFLNFQTEVTKVLKAVYDERFVVN
jgi:hypothetical protein